MSHTWNKSRNPSQAMDSIVPLSITVNPIRVHLRQFVRPLWTDSLVLAMKDMIPRRLWTKMAIWFSKIAKKYRIKLSRNPTPTRLRERKRTTDNISIIDL